MLEATRENTDLGALLTLAAQGAGSVQSPLQLNPGCRGVQLVVNITAMTGTGPTLTVTLKGHDAATDTDYTLLASAALAATGQTVLTVYPGAVVTANVSANANLPLEWSVTATVAGTTPAVTATISANTLI